MFSEGGYFADTSPAAIALAGNQNINKSGFTGGVIAGYSGQINNAMFGIETDFNYFGHQEIVHPYRRLSVLRSAHFHGQLVQIHRLALDPSAVVVRLSRLLPALLLYGTGGLAVADLKASYLLHRYVRRGQRIRFDLVHALWLDGGCRRRIRAAERLVDQG